MSSDASLCVDCEQLPWDHLVFESDDIVRYGEINTTSWDISRAGQCQFCAILRKL